MLYTVMKVYTLWKEEWTQHFVIKCITQSFSGVREDKDRLWYSIFTNPSSQAGYDTRSIFKQSLTAILTLNFFFSWLYHTVLSSRLHLALLLLLSQGLLNCCGLLGVLLNSKLALIQDSHWPPTDSDPHVGFCIYHFIMLMISNQPHSYFSLFT